MNIIICFNKLSQQRNPDRRGIWNSKRQIDVVTFNKPTTTNNNKQQQTTTTNNIKQQQQTTDIVY